MKRSTEQVLRDEIAAAAKAVDAAETKLDQANEAATFANADVKLRTSELTEVRARLARAEAALSAFTPPMPLFSAEELEAKPAPVAKGQVELELVEPADVPNEGEVS